GLPSWLLEGKPLTLRSASGPYLEACSRFITAVADEIRDLQVTSPGKGGPIVLVQSENNWNCGVEHLATEYLGELNRYLREGGIAVPILSSNNLWQSVEGQIDVWSGSGDLLSTMRQLSAVRATQPRMVIDYGARRATVFNAVRRICYFASRFGRVFANLEPTFLPVCIDPARHAAQQGAKKTKASEGANLSAIYAQGNQGSVAFIFG